VEKPQELIFKPSLCFHPVSLHIALSKGIEIGNRKAGVENAALFNPVRQAIV
jgi:hypothetical protein